jgi:lipopolysaccharide export system permease protein
MIFSTSLRRDLSSLAGVVFATLFTIMLTTTLIRMLGRAAGDRMDAASLFPLIAFSSIRLLPALMVLAIYIAVLMSLSRAFRDSEMVVWFACGRSLLDWIRPVMRFALPLVVLIAGVAFELAPWANREIARYTQNFEQREDVSRVAAGQFSESSSGARVFFVESLSEDEASVSNVFVTQHNGEQLTIVVAANGHIENKPSGERFLVLQGGRRYDGDPQGSGFRIMEFEKYGLRLVPKAGGPKDLAPKEKSTIDLLRSAGRRDMAELLWRINLPISAVVLALFAIPLASFNPRVGRSVNLVVALLVYVLYTNLVSVSQAWVAQGRITFGLGVWVIHGIFLAVVALLYWHKLSLIRFRLTGWRRGVAR